MAEPEIAEPEMAEPEMAEPEIAEPVTGVKGIDIEEPVTLLFSCTVRPLLISASAILFPASMQNISNILLFLLYL